MHAGATETMRGEAGGCTSSAVSYSDVTHLNYKIWHNSVNGCVLVGQPLLFQIVTKSSIQYNRCCICCCMVKTGSVENGLPNLMVHVHVTAKSLSHVRAIKNYT